MRQIYRIMIMLVVLMAATAAFSQKKNVVSKGLTAQQVVAKTASLVNGAKGLQATFTVSASGHSSKGSIKASGRKFTVEMPEVAYWYDGAALFTYNSRTSETTVVTPTASELAEANPLLYMNGIAGGYTAVFSKQKVAGRYVVEITPKSTKSGIRKIVATVNASTFYPEKVSVTGSGNVVSSLIVTSLKLNVSIPVSSFVYPKTRYPNAEIVDLR